MKKELLNVSDVYGASIFDEFYFMREYANSFTKEIIAAHCSGKENIDKAYDIGMICARWRRDTGNRGILVAISDVGIPSLIDFNNKLEYELSRAISEECYKHDLIPFLGYKTYNNYYKIIVISN